MIQLRNQIIAAVSLLVFIAAGVLYYNIWVVQRPFGVILVISDALTMENIASSRLVDGKSPRRLEIESMTDVALLSNLSRSHSAANPLANTVALSTGMKSHRTIDRIIQDGGKPGRLLIEQARRRGRSSGIVTNTDLTSHVVAPFYTQIATSRTLIDRARALTENENLDIIIGTGVEDFIPTEMDGKRIDGRNLLREFSDAGFHVHTDPSELQSKAIWGVPRTIAVFEDISLVDSLARPTANTSFQNAVAEAIRALQYNRRGYLLIVNVSGDAGDTPASGPTAQAITDFLLLDSTLKTARQYAGRKSLIIAVGRPKLNQRNASDVVALSSGEGSDEINGIIKDTDLYSIIVSHL